MLIDILPNGIPDPTMPQPSVVDVVESIGHWTTFSLSFGLTIDNEDVPMLQDSRLGPEAELALRVQNGTSFEILAKGPVTQHKISMPTGGDGASLTVMGADLAIGMAREHKVRVWPTTTDAAALNEIILSQGYIADIDLPSTITHTEDKNALIQRDSDWHFIKKISARNGCWFWLHHDPVLMLPTFCIKRPPVDVASSADLYVSGNQRNVIAVEIEWDCERTVAADAMHVDVRTLSDMEGHTQESPINALGSTPFSQVVQATRKRQLSVAVDDAGDLMVRSQAALIEQSWFIRVRLSVVYSVIQQVIRTHSVVTLHGVGTRHSGKYMVSNVHHHITAEEHTMNVELIRNAWD